MNIADLQDKTRSELHEIAKEMSIGGYSVAEKRTDFADIRRSAAEGFMLAQGVLRFCLVWFLLRRRNYTRQ